jgi:C-terminal processing protease CtpA/Prc
MACEVWRDGCFDDFRIEGDGRRKPPLDGSSAFKGDLFEGDVIVSVNSHEIVDPISGGKVIRGAYGQKDVVIELYRDGNKLKKTIDVDPE